LPGDLVGIVEAVLGLDNRPQAQPHFRSTPLGSSNRDATIRQADVSNPVSFTPPELAILYRFPPSSGQGQCIGLIELGGGYRAADLTAYFSTLGLTPPKGSAVSVDHGRDESTGDTKGPDGEVMLDIEIAGALAPAAHIVAYFVPNTDAEFLDAITTAIHDTTNKPSVISISWGRPEPAGAQQSLSTFDTAFQAATPMGITVTAAFGDSGSDDEVADGAAHVDSPASSAFVLARGGISLQTANGKISRETGWNNGTDNGATGGGVSCVFALPPYQKNLTVAGQGKAAEARAVRGVPDVAGVADPRTGYALHVDSSDLVSGGASAVAPLSAGLIARLNTAGGAPLGYLHPRFYQDPGVLNDIVVGDNGDFSACPAGTPVAASARRMELL
jgi:kumamolisin